MAVSIGNISQKGGVGKSTLSRMIAVEYARSGWEVLIADLDPSQGTSFEWNSRRIENGVEPEISVQQFGSVDRVLKIADKYDLVVYDGAPHSTRATEQIAKVSDFVILPTGNSLDDINPQIKLAHELVKAGIDRNKIAFAMVRVGASDAENQESLEYIGMSGYKILKGGIPEKTGYRRASDQGKAITETAYKSLNNHADELMQSVVNELK